MSEEQAAENVKPISASEQVVKKDETMKFEGLRCSTCREVKTDDQLSKQPLDYKKNDDGSITPVRLSIFCSTCQMFLCIYDPVARKELKDIIDNRSPISPKKS